MAHMSGGMGIQNQILQLNVVGCKNLSDKEWFSRQDPYVTVEYANSKFRTRTDRDGGKNPRFNEKFTIPLVEGLREINVQVWNSNIVSFDDYIGYAKVYLEKVLTTGYDDSSWALKSKTGKSAGEVNLILHYSNAKTGSASHSAYLSAAHGAPGGYPSAYAAPSGYSPAHGAPTGYAPAPAPGYPAAPSFSSQSYHSVPSGYPPTSGYPPPSSAYSQSSHGASYSAPSGYPPPVAHPAAGYAPSPRQNSYASAPHGTPPYPAPYPGLTSQSPAGYPGAPPSGYGAPPGGHKAGKVHVGSSGHYKHGKHRKNKCSKFGKKYKGGKGKGWKGKK